MGGAAGMRVRNPRSGELDHDLAPLASDAIGVLAAALRGRQASRAARGATELGAVLRAFGVAIARHRDAIAATLTIDTGRRAISTIEVDGTIRTLDRWAGVAPDLIARARLAARQRHARNPCVDAARSYPMVGAISPWNFPLTLALIDAIPALAAG